MSGNSRTPEPSPKAGQEGGDEQHDEERIQGEIITLKGIINELPCKNFEDALSRAPHQKKLGQLEYKYQLLVEQKRLARELLKFVEEHGALYSEPCLICLENIHVHASMALVHHFLCCGGFICTICAARHTNGPEIGLGDKCPLCRESYKTTEAEIAEKFMVLAKRGVAWAQTDAGRRMVHGAGGFKKQEKSGLEWLNKAAAQNYPPALYLLAELYRNGLAHLLRKSQEKANELLLKSANLGYAMANSQLATMYCLGADGFEEDLHKCYFRSSVVFALDDTDKRAAAMLSHCHYPEQNITEPSPYLVCYYLNIAVNEKDGGKCYLYSEAIARLNKHQHNSQEIPGFNAIPTVFFWARKACDLGCNEASDWLKTLESAGQSQCANCCKEAQDTVKFKQCSKCKAQWYCSKECQVEAWRAGHRKDCKRARILKFEDYMNAE